jgi:hypothetical protein
MDSITSDFVLAGSLEEIKAKEPLVVHGQHRPVLLLHDGGTSLPRLVDSDGAPH